MQPQLSLSALLKTLAMSALFVAASVKGSTWIADLDGDWSDAGNWFEGHIPAVIGANVNLRPQMDSNDLVSTIDAGWSASGSVNGLTFLPVPQTTADNGTFILAPGAGVNNLAIGPGGIRNYGALNAMTLNIPIFLSANQTWLAQRTTTQWNDFTQRINVTALVDGTSPGTELTLRGGPHTTRSTQNTSVILSGADGQLGGNISRLDLTGGVLQLGDSTTDTHFNRIADTTVIASNGGTLTVHRQGNGTEGLGGLRLESGNFSVIGLAAGSGTSVYRFASLDHRADGTVLRLDSGRNNAEEVNFQFADVSGFGAGSNGIIGGWAIARTQQAGWRFLAIPSDDTTMITIAGSNASDSPALMAMVTNDNVNLTAASGATYTLTGNLTLHSLRNAVNGNSLIDLGSNTLTLNSGGFIASTTGFSNRTDFNNGTLTAGTSNTLYFHQGGENIFNSIRFMSGSVIANNSNGAVDVVYAGRLADDSVGFTLNSTSNTYTGRTFINNAGIDMSNHTEVAGNASIFGTVPTSFSAGNLVFDGVFFKVGSYTFHENRGIELRGAGLLNHNGNITINGAISGTGQILASSAVLTLGGSMHNTYSGDTIVAYANLGNSPDLRLQLNKQDGAIAVPGDLFISVPSNAPNNSLGTTVRLLGSNQIADTSVVTMLRPDNEGTGTSTGRAIFQLNGNNETIAGLVGIAGTATNVVVENSHASSASILTLAPGAGRHFSYEGVMQDGGGGSLSLVIAGHPSGRQALYGANTYSSGTTINGGTLIAGHNNALGTGLATVNQGTLALDGVTVSTPVTFNAGSALVGNGTLVVGDDLNAPDTIAPGFSTGTLIIDVGAGNTLTMNATTTTEIEIADLTNFDLLAVTGNASLAGTLSVTLLDGYLPVRGTTFDVITSTGTGTMTGLVGLGGPDGMWFSSAIIDGNILRLTSQIPEPTSALLLALAGMVMFRKGKRD